MNRFWDFILEPLITSLDPETILEVGADRGQTTVRLIDYCAFNGARLEVVDPCICDEIRSRAAPHRNLIGLYAQNSLEALKLVRYPDLALIDGDHNWYTVFNELKALEKRACEENRDFPFSIMHDTGWPYGYRDMYHNPVEIPEEERQPYAQLGMRPGESALCVHGGINRGVLNATHHGGDKNGIRTAIDDFLTQSSLQLVTLELSGFNGLFLIYPAVHEQNLQFLAQLRESISPTIKQYIQALEGDRLRLELLAEERHLQSPVSRSRQGTAASIGCAGTRALYLDLLKSALTDLIYSNDSDFASRHSGREWPPAERAHTMIGIPRLDNIQLCIEEVLKNGVPGDLIEAGVWRGGAAIFMRAALNAFGETSRQVWVADSFEGVPAPDAGRYPADSGDEHYLVADLSVSLETVKENFRRYGLLSPTVQFVRGWFKDTLRHIPVEQFSIIRLDGDLYQSTIECLESLYPRLAVGGFVIVDDYGAVPGCRKAVEDYRERFGITDKVRSIDWTGIFWQKSANTPLSSEPEVDESAAPPEVVTVDFFLLGAAKCATTALYSWLKSHPGITMSVEKEPYFFEAEYERGPEHYSRRYFLPSGQPCLFGEARHRNLYLPYIAERIFEYNPNAKLLVVVRHPIERALSHWWHWHDRGQEKHSFAGALIEDFARIRRKEIGSPEEVKLQYGNLRASGNEYFLNYAPDRRTYLDSGHYTEQISRYDDRFDQDQIKIVLFDDLLDHSRDTLADVSGFLGVDSAAVESLDFIPMNESRHMDRIFGSRIEDWLSATEADPPSKASNLRHIFLLKPELCALLQAYYEPHIEALESRLGRNLPWSGPVTADRQRPILTVQDWLCALDPRLALLLEKYSSIEEFEKGLYPLFDADFYLRQLSLSEPTALSPFEHYLAHGDHSSRNISPGPCFDPVFYDAQRQTAEPCFGNPLLHFITEGFESGLAPNPLLVAPEFRDQVQTNDLSGLLLFMRKTLLTGARFYSPSRDGIIGERINRYATERGLSAGTCLHLGARTATLPDVAFKAWQFGKLFDEAFYLRNYPDIRNADVNPYQHFLDYGSNEGRQPSILFDNSFYRSTYGEVRSFDADSITHYLEEGSKRHLDPHPLFNSRHYLASGPGPERPDLTPLEHYLTFGSENRCDPSPAFDTEHYLAQLPPDTPLNEAPLAHYLRSGRDQGLSILDPHRLKASVLDDYMNPVKSAALHFNGPVIVYASARGNYFMRQIADLYACGLEDAGVDVTRADESAHHPSGAIPIVIAPHEFFTLGRGEDRASEILSRAILINTEQPGSPWFDISLDFLRQAALVFDISVSSTCFLRRHGVRAFFMPLGYRKGFAPFDSHIPADLLNRIPGLPPSPQNPGAGISRASDRPIDVLFLSSATTHRMKALTSIAGTLARYACFIHVPPVDGIFHSSHGEITPNASVALSRKSKILLNIHQSDQDYFEWHRIVLLGMWQKTLVVSEPCDRIPGFVPNLHYIECSTDEMPSTLSWLLDTEAGQAKSRAVIDSAYRVLTETMDYGEILASRHLPVFMAS